MIRRRRITEDINAEDLYDEIDTLLRDNHFILQNAYGLDYFVEDILDNRRSAEVGIYSNDTDLYYQLFYRNNDSNTFFIHASSIDFAINGNSGLVDIPNIQKLLNDLNASLKYVLR